MVNYWVKVAAQRGFAVDQATILPDHVHLLVRITPKISVEQAALSLMNNGQYFVAKHFPLTLVEAKIDQLWQPSAYVGTCGELTDRVVEGFSEGKGRRLSMNDPPTALVGFRVRTVLQVFIG